MRKSVLFVLLIVLVACTNKEEKAEEKFRQGIKAIEKNELDKAMTYLNAAIDYNDKNPEYYFYLGNIHMNKKNFNKAIKKYDQAIAIDSTYYDAWDNKGTVIFYQTGKREEACPYWLKAHELGKKNMRNKIKSCSGFHEGMLR